MLLACKSLIRFSDQCANTGLLLQPGRGKTRYRVTHSHCRVTRSAQLRHPLWLVSDGCSPFSSSQEQALYTPHERPHPPFQFAVPLNFASQCYTKYDILFRPLMRSINRHNFDFFLRCPVRPSDCGCAIRLHS